MFEGDIRLDEGEKNKILEPRAERLGQMMMSKALVHR
jgi:hypothetical protein